jgi:hypothetical protein
MAMERAVAEVVTAVKPELWYMLAQACVIFVIVLVLKRVFENYSAYIMFKLNKNLGVGTRIMVNGMDGVIENYDRSSIYIRVDEGNVLMIPIARWRYQNWIVQDFMTKEMKEYVNRQITECKERTQEKE